MPAADAVEMRNEKGVWSDMVQKVVLSGILCIAGYQDWKKKKVSAYLFLIGGAAGILCHFCNRQITTVDMLLGAAIGMVLFLCGFVSRENVGYGDAAAVTVSGIFLGFAANLELLCVALFLLAFAALFFIVIKKKGRRYRIPFLPFLSAGYLILLVV